MVKLAAYALAVGATFVLGLSALGYKYVVTLCVHIAILAAISRILIGICNEVSFRMQLHAWSSRAARVYRDKKLPPPRKYGYRHDDRELCAWHGQTYLEEILGDMSVHEVTRLEAKILVNDIYIAERRSMTDERRLMRVALHAMKKYDKWLAAGRSQED
jgi:hypothetical protein